MDVLGGGRQGRLWNPVSSRLSVPRGRLDLTDHV